MLEVQNYRSLLKIGTSAIPSKGKMKKLLNSMVMMLNPDMGCKLREVGDLSKSIFEISHFVEVFKGETMKIANYNVFHKSIQFAKCFFADKSKKNVLSIVQSDTKTEIQISCENIKIFKASFAYDNSIGYKYCPIEIVFVRSNATYEEQIDFFTKKLNNLQTKYSELKACYPKFNPHRNSDDILLAEEQELKSLPSKIMDIQQELQNIIKLRQEGVTNINRFYEEYIKYFSIDLKQKYTSWYQIYEIDLRDSF